MNAEVILVFVVVDPNLFFLCLSLCEKRRNLLEVKNESGRLSDTEGSLEKWLFMSIRVC